MAYRESQLESRERYLKTYDTSEAAKYESWVSALTADDHNACLTDIGQAFQFAAGMSVLDAGAGTGALCSTLVRVGGLRLTALEPCPAMSNLLRSKPELNDVTVVQGFCDHRDDRPQFAASVFDVIASRQLTNCLFDPLAAFRNWYYWLRDRGTVIVMDGLYDRVDWSGRWEGTVDTLPLAACRTTATVPYLLEHAGFQVDFVGFMESTNSLASTRTRRYIVVSTKHGG